ncbi:MAG TPA: efflux RND transporter permease subunit [Actinomycetota bacterium]
MRWLIGSSLRLRRVVVVVAAGVIVLGVAQLWHASVDTLPEFGPPTVQVQTEALGLSAPEVEQLITVPLEQDLLAGVPWLDTMRSASIPGLSSIELIFDPGTDLLRARQVVQERLTQAAGLPNVSATPHMLQPLSSTSRIMMIRLSSATVSPIEMSVLARWTIRPKLLGVQGVANVSIWGQRERQLQVQVDPDRLSTYGLSLDHIIETSGNALWASPLTFLEASTPGTGGFIDTANQRLGIQHLQPITTASDLAKVPIDRARGGTLRLGDVADVVEDHQPLIGDAIFTDGDPGLLLIVEKFPGANTLDVTHDVESALDALRPGLSGVALDPTVYRPAGYMERSAANLGIALVISLVLVIVALGVILLGWRSAVVGLAAILSSFSVALLVLFLRGTTINTMVLAGLVMALAVVIDDAVINLDNAARRLHRQRLNGVEPTATTVVIEASLEMRSAALYATLITLAAVVPVLFLQGEAAPFIPPVALSFVLALLASMIVALTVTPALSLLLLRGAPLERRGSSVAAWVQRGYGRLSVGASRSPRRTYVGAGAVVLAGLIAIPFLGSSALPVFRDGNVLIDLHAVPGTSLPEMDRITDRVGQELLSLPGVLDVGAHIGRAITSDQVVGVDAAQLWVSVGPDADYDATVDSIRSVVEGYPGIEHIVRTYSDERIGAVLPPPGSPVVVRVYGQDLQVLRMKADEVRGAMAGIEGIAHPSVELQPQQPTVNVSVDLRTAERYGVVPGDVRRAAATLLSGIGVGSLFEQQKVFDVVVWGTPDTRNSLNSVQDLLIDTRSGGHVRLGKVADVAIASTPTVIRHQDISRSLDVTADVDGRDVGAVAEDVRNAIGRIAFPLEYHAELVGDFAERQAADRRAVAVAIAAAIGIFLLLQAALGSWRLAAVSFFVLPLAMVGCVLALAVAGLDVSLGSAAGFVTVLAISMRTGITLLRHYQHLERDEGVAFGEALIQRGSRERCIPIVATAVASGLALLPFALSGSVAGQEITHPMAITIIGGLITSTVLVLFVLPSLYLRYGSTPEAEPSPTAVVVVPEIERVSES